MRLFFIREKGEEDKEEERKRKEDKEEEEKQEKEEEEEKKVVKMSRKGKLVTVWQSYFFFIHEQYHLQQFYNLPLHSELLWNF